MKANKPSLLRPLRWALPIVLSIPFLAVIKWVLESDGCTGVGCPGINELSLVWLAFALVCVAGLAVTAYRDWVLGGYQEDLARWNAGQIDR